MKTSRLFRAAFVSVFALAIVVGSYAATDAFQAAGGPPTVAVSSVAFSPAGVTCGVEFDCFRVTWTASVPNKGTTITGFDVELTAKKANGTSSVAKKSVAGSAREADLGVFQTGSNVTSYVAKVTANYTSVVAASKSGNL